MLSKNFIFTALFFIIFLSCISCLRKESKNENTELDITPTDSGSFTNSLEHIESIKIPNFKLEGKWKLISDSLRDEKEYHLYFKNRKVHLDPKLLSTSYQAYQNYNKEPQTFAFYDKCPFEGGCYDKEGSFIVIGSKDEKKLCYQILSLDDNKLVLLDITQNKELVFEFVPTLTF